MFYPVSVDLVLLIGINDGKKLDEPVDGFDEKTGKISGKNYELTYLKPLSEYVIMLKKTVNDVMSPRYGMPELYTLNNVDIETGTSENNVTVHWTRVIHIADNKGISDVFGVPRLQPVVNYVLDCKKLLGSSAEMFWKGGFPGIAFEIDKERQTSLTAAEKKSLRSEFLDYTNKLQRYMALVGVTAKSLEVQVADPSPHFLAYLKAIAITYGVPYRKLIGSEEAKLASAEDSKTWNRRVTRRQNEHVSSGIIRLLIDRFIGLGILPEVEYDVTWPPLSEDDPKEQSEISKNKVDAIAKYMTSGADALIEPKSFFTNILGMEEGEADEIIDATEIWVDDHIDESELEDDMSNPNDGDNNGKNQQPKN